MRETATRQKSKTQQRVLKRGMKTFRVKEVSGNCNEVMCLADQEVAGNCNEVLKINLTTTMCKSHTLDTLRKSSRTCDKNWVSVLTLSTRRPTCRFGAYLCRQRWIHQFILDFNIKRIWVANRNTNFEELKMLFDITLRLIVEESFELLNVSTTENTCSLWIRSTLCHDQAIKWAKAKVNV